MSGSSPIERLLTDIRGELSGHSWRARRALLTEVRTHLHDAADDEHARGLDRETAEQRACDRFGTAAEFGRLAQRDTRSHRRAVGLALTGAVVGALATVAAVSVLGTGPAPPPQQAEFIAFSHFSGGSGRVGGRGVWLLGPAGARLIATPTRVGQTALSPDGSRIAFIGQTCRGRRCLESLSIVGVNDHRVRTLTTGWRGVLDLTWSPDGRRIAFSGDHADRRSSIYIATVGGRVRRMSDAHAPGIDDEPAWSPDGRSIAYRRVTTGWSIMRVDIATGHTADISRAHFGGAAQPAWSPDGRWIAVAGEPPGKQYGLRGDVYVIHPDGSGVTRLTAGIRRGAAYPQWSPIGDRLLVVQEPRPSYGPTPPSLTMDCSPLWVVDPNPSSPPRRVGCGINSWWAAGGRRIIYTRQTLANPATDPRLAAEMSIWSVAATAGHPHRLYQAASLLSFPSTGT